MEQKQPSSAGEGEVAADPAWCLWERRAETAAGWEPVLDEDERLRQLRGTAQGHRGSWASSPVSPRWDTAGDMLCPTLRPNPAMDRHLLFFEAQI